jgi:hypothetical protein
MKAYFAATVTGILTGPVTMMGLYFLHMRPGGGPSLILSSLIGFGLALMITHTITRGGDE